MPPKEVQHIARILLAIGDAARTNDWQVVQSLLETNQHAINELAANQRNITDPEQIRSLIEIQEKVSGEITSQLGVLRKSEASRHEAKRSSTAFKQANQHKSVGIKS